MDSISNLSLLEIAGEDDSLLLTSTVRDDDCSVSTATNVFSCSPLLSLRSRPPPTLIEVRVGDVDSENTSSSPKVGDVNKENLNWSAPKLSVEPQQMKKRKKNGGGYNLRKSLAWDRAFFTEQGVLNPLELSMISGTSTPVRTNSDLKLNIIHEEEQTSASLAIQEIEENLFKQSSDSVSRESRNSGVVGLSPKPVAFTKDTLAPPSAAKRKVLAVNDVAGNRSKRNACPRPVASSSPDTSKAQSKESKVSKIPGPKPNDSVITTTARSGTLSNGSSKRNQNAHPATNVQKHAGLKGLSKNLRTVPSNPKADLADKFSVTRTLTKRAGKHLDNSVSETHPPSRLHQPGTGANKVSGACLPQGVSDTSEKRQQTQVQTTKPSGLRMPSPSLGFFSQTKASSSHSQLKKGSKPCKPTECNIPKLRKLETNSVNNARLPHAPGKRSEIVEGTSQHYTKKLSLSDVKSERSMQEDKKQMAGIEVGCDSLGFETISYQEMVDNKQMHGVEVECDSLGFEKISKKEMSENIIEHVNTKSYEQAELHTSDNVSHMKGVQFPTHEKKLLSKSHTHEQLHKEADHFSEDKLYDILSNGDQSIFQEPESMQHHGMQRTLIGKDNISNTIHNTMVQDDDGQIKLLACDVLTSNESLVLLAKHGTSSKDSRHSGEIMEYNCVKTALINSSLVDSAKTVLGESLPGIPYKNTERVNDGAGFGIHGGDAQVYLLNGDLSVHCSDTKQSILEAVDQQLEEEQLKTPNPSIIGEVRSKDENESHVNSCQLVRVTTLSSKGFPQKSIPEINGACENEPKRAEIEDCQHPVDGESGFIRRRPVNGGYDEVIDSKVIHDRNQAFELDMMCEDCITASAAACSTELNNVSPESRLFYENNIENLHFTPELCTMVNAECDSRGNDMSANNRSTISELMLRKDGSSRDTSMQCDVQRDVPGNFEQHTYNEINRMLCEDESSVPNHGHFSEVCADFISSTKDSIGSGAEYPSGILQHTLLTQSVRESDHANRDIKESRMEDAQTQTINEDPVVYNCRDEDFLSVTNDPFSLVDDNNINQEPHLFELHLDGDCLPANIACSGEIKKKNFFEGALEGCNIYTSEQGASSHHIQAAPENKDGSLHVDERAERLEMGDEKKESTDILPLVEIQLNHKVVSAEFDSSTRVSKDPITEVDLWKSDEHRSLSENSKLPASDNATFDAKILQDSEVSSLNRKCFSEEAENDIFDKAKKESTDILPLVEIQLNHKVVSAEFDSSTRVSEDPITEVGLWKSDEHCSLSENSKLPASYNVTFHTSILLGSEVSSLNRKSFSEEAETKIFDKEEFPDTDMQLDDNINDEPHLSELHLDGYCLPANTACSEEIKKINFFEGALEGCNIYTCEQDASNHHIQATPENKDESLHVDERAEQLEMGDAKKGSTDILPLVGIQLSHKVVSAKFDSSTRVSEDPITEVGHWKSDEHCSLSENSKSPASDNVTFHARILQGSEVSSLNRKSFSEEAETKIFVKEEFPNTDMQYQTKGGIGFAEDSSQIIHLEESATKSKPEVPTLKPPPNAAPFSDEWLAAIEAAGEEILTMKGGAVQNSPPEKPQHEPGPWSPVRRKSQAIGPFDCTKHTNIPHSSSL